MICHYPYASGMRRRAGVVCPVTIRITVKIYDRGVFMNRRVSARLNEKPGRRKTTGLFYCPVTFKNKKRILKPLRGLA